MHFRLRRVCAHARSYVAANVQYLIALTISPDRTAIELDWYDMALFNAQHVAIRSTANKICLSEKKN